MGALEYGTGTAPASLQEARDRAERSLRAVWDRQRMPKERFEISFRSSWGACGQAMTALDSFGADDMSWEHDAGVHRVRFTCTFATLKSIQAAMCSVPAVDRKCRRLQALSEEGAS